MSRTLTQLPINEIQRLQQARSVFAVGKYQGIPATLNSWIQANRIDTSVPFSPAAQEQFGTFLLTQKRPLVGRYVNGDTSVTIEQAQTALSQEFASLPKPGTPESRVGFYDSDSAGNRALTTSGELQNALIAARNAKNLQILKDFISKFEGSYESINIIPNVGDRARAPRINSNEYYAALVGNGAQAWQALATNKSIDPNLVVAGGLPTTATVAASLDDAYIKTTYVDPLSKPGYAQPKVVQLLQGGTLKAKSRDGTTTESILSLVKKEGITSTADLDGDIQLIQAVGQLSTEALAIRNTALGKVSNLPKSDQYFLVAQNLYELNADRMRNAMASNTGISSVTGELPPGAPAHAWRSPGKLAVTGDVTIPGFAGFRIGQIFWIGRTYEHYKQFGAFQLFGITENIDLSNGWTTELHSRFNVIPIDKIRGIQSE